METEDKLGVLAILVIIALTINLITKYLFWFLLAAAIIGVIYYYIKKIYY